MGVSVRTSRNTRVYLPWWLAVPWALCVLAGWLVYAVVHGIFVAVGWLYRAAEARRLARRG